MSSGMRARPLGRVRRQCSKRSANSVNASSAGVSIGIDIGSISQIDHEMGLYLRSATLQMSRTLTGSTRCCYSRIHQLQYRKRTEIAVEIVRQLEAGDQFPQVHYGFDKGVFRLP